jgi:hypothetical protein
MEKQLYVVSFGCGCGENEELIRAKSLEAAEKYAYEKAIEDYESYEGLHGILDMDDIANEYNLDPEEDEEEIEVLYLEERENSISYSAEEFDLSNDYHKDLFEHKEVYEV